MCLVKECRKTLSNLIGHFQKHFGAAEIQSFSEGHLFKQGEISLSFGSTITADICNGLALLAGGLARSIV